MSRARELLPRINLYLTAVSAASALLTLLLITCGRQFAVRGEMKRVSVRLTQGVSLVVLLKAGVMLLFMYTSTAGAVCTGLSFAVHWLSLLYVFLGVAMAANLHSVALRGAKPHPLREPVCWILPLMLATALIGAPLGKRKSESANPQSLASWVWTTPR